jgi:O-antigen ligase
MSTATAPRVEDRPGVLLAVGVVGATLAIPLALLAAINPLYAAGSAVGVAVLTLCVLRVDFAVLLLAAAAPLESAVAISSNETITITKVAGLVCFASFALYAIGARHKIVLDRSHAIVFLLLGIALLSTVQADEVPTAVSTTIRYAAFVAMFVIVSQFLGDRVLQRRLAWTLSLACACAGLLAVYNFLVTHETLVAKPTYGDPNDLAFVLATTLPLTFWLLGDRGYLRPLVLALIAAIGASIVLTFSRGALVGLAAAALWHFVTERRHAPILLAGVLVAAAGAATLIQSSPDRFDVGFEAKQSVAEENVRTRLGAWSAATRLAGENPLLGVGPGNFATRFEQLGVTIDPADLNPVVHNAYLDIAAELGFVALFLFLAYLVESFGRLTGAVRRGYGAPGYASAVRTALIVAAVSALFLSEQYYAPFWLIGGIATGLWVEGRRAEAARALPA